MENKKNIKQTLILILFFDIALWCIKKVCANFQKKILIFKFLWFFENENFAARARAAEIADFLELNSQKFAWSPVKCKFQNSKKC